MDSNEAITFQQLREAKLVGARGPAPNPALMAIANELATNELAGISITEQSIKSVALRLGGPEIAGSGGHRKRAHDYANKILEYRGQQASIARESAETFADTVFNMEATASATVSAAPVVLSTDHSTSAPFIVGDDAAPSEQETPMQTALSAAAAAAAEEGEEVEDIQAKLERLALEVSPVRGGASSSASGADPESQEQALHRDEIDARAHIEADAGIVNPHVNDSLSAAAQNHAMKDELRRFWLVHKAGFSEWWNKLTPKLRRGVLRSVGPHMNEQPDPGHVVPEMSLSWLAEGTRTASSSPPRKEDLIRELESFADLLCRDPIKAANVLNARPGEPHYVMMRNRLVLDGRDMTSGPQHQPFDQIDARDLMISCGMTAAQAAELGRAPVLSSSNAHQLEGLTGYERNLKLAEAYMDKGIEAEIQIDPSRTKISQYYTYTDGTFERWYAGECRALGFAVGSDGAASTEHGPRLYTRRWPPRPMGLLWLMEQRAGSLWDDEARQLINRTFHLSEHADDALDLEVLKRLRSKGLKRHSLSPPFDPSAPIMVGLGLNLQEASFGPNKHEFNVFRPYLTRGHSEISPRSKASSMLASSSMLAVRSYDAVAIDEDLFSWLLERQSMIYCTLLAVAGSYLEERGISSTHLLASQVSTSSSGALSNADIKKQLKLLQTDERAHAVARAQIAAAAVFQDEGRLQDAEVRLTVAMEVLGKAQTEMLVDFVLLARAAQQLAALARAPSAPRIARTLQDALALPDWPNALKKGTKQQLESVKSLLPRPVEYRKCGYCHHEKRKVEFSNNQWLKGKRRCFSCQGSGVTLTPEELEEASERAAETAEMAQLYEEALKIERKRVEAELARRNEAAPGDNECVVCLEEWTDTPAQMTYRAVMPCNHPICASCLFALPPTEVPRKVASMRRTFHIACPVCRKGVDAAKQATCEVVADADESLKLLSSHLPFGLAQQRDVLIKLLEVGCFRVRQDNLEAHDWRKGVEERLWEMVSAVPDFAMVSSEASDLTPSQKQKIYQEARRPVILLENSLRVAHKEGYGPEQISDLERRLDAAKDNAAADIFAQLNAQGLNMGDGGRNEFWQDFHGLHVDEAKAKLTDLIEQVLPAIRTIVIITGRGIHSPNGNAKIQKAVRQLVASRESLEITPVEGNPGALRLNLK